MSLSYSRKIAVSAMFVVAILAMTCKNDVSGPNGETSNLIRNPSFENGDLPTFQYWNLNDTLPDSLLHFADDAPAIGGIWSLSLMPAFFPEEGFARYYITGESPLTAYRLTIWAKALNGWTQGSVKLGILTFGQWTPRKSVAVAGDSWQMYSLEDTVRLFPEDTFVVHLSAGSSELSAGDPVLFDEVRLEKR